MRLHETNANHIHNEGVFLAVVGAVLFAAGTIGILLTLAAGATGYSIASLLIGIITTVMGWIDLREARSMRRRRAPSCDAGGGAIRG